MTEPPSMNIAVISGKSLFTQTTNKQSSTLKQKACGFKSNSINMSKLNGFQLLTPQAAVINQSDCGPHLMR